MEDIKSLVTHHVHSADIPWIDFGGGTKTRILHARPEENFVVTQIRAEPGAETKLHRHQGPVFGWTLEGEWGHDRNYEYRPGTYIFETPGVVHKFLGGDKPIEAVFVSFGNLEYIDEETGEVIATLEPSTIIEQYLQACEDAGHERPNILK